MTDREAAERAGIDPGRAAYVKAKPRVKEYMEQHRASVTAGLVQHEVEALAEFNISREQVMARYVELARLSPAETNGNISGQVKALDSLREMTGWVGPKTGEKPGEEPPEPPNIYRPPWLLERQRGIFREREESSEREFSNQEPAPAPEPARIDRRPAAVPQSPTANGSAPRNPGSEPTEPDSRFLGASFGRFQRL